MKRRIAIAMLVILGSVTLASANTVHADAPSCQQSDPFCYAPTAQTYVKTITTVTLPAIAVPSWLGAGQ